MMLTDDVIAYSLIVGFAIIVTTAVMLLLTLATDGYPDNYTNYSSKKRLRDARKRRFAR